MKRSSKKEFPGYGWPVQNPIPVLTLLWLLLTISCGTGSTVIELPAAQSMSITGKGPGQDAAINPFSDSNSVALVKNLGPAPFSIRIQDKSGNYREIRATPGETREVLLPMGYELYFDSALETRVPVSFRKTAKMP